MAVYWPADKCQCGHSTPGTPLEKVVCENPDCGAEGCVVCAYPPGIPEGVPKLCKKCWRKGASAALAQMPRA
jgi:hypothetical protein